MAITINGNGTVTGISVGGLPDGIVDTDMLAASAVSTAKIADDAVTTAKSTITPGITGYDTWSLTADKNWSGFNVFDANFTRNTNFPAIGSAMTMSSGAFTFPTTGIWEIELKADVYDGTPNAYSEVYIHKSTDSGSNWTTIALGNDSIWDDDQNVYCNPSAKGSIDVTNTSTIKARLSIHNEQGAHVAANASTLRTYAIFKRIGDT